MFKYISIAVVGFMVLLFAGIIGIYTMMSSVFAGGDEGLSSGGYYLDGTAKVSPEIERYRSFFEKYAKKYGVEDHVDLIMALAMQESGGRHLDVMQSSESLGLPPNSITDPELSIDVGVKYFSQVLKQAGGDVKLALQSYNFGTGFIGFVKENGGKYTKDLAIEFSNMMAIKMGWPRYGDVNYVDNVLRYLDGFKATPVQGGKGKWAMPVENVNITSPFGNRSDPITGQTSFHAGVDFACSTSDPIYSVADGTVVRSEISGNYGNVVTVDHGDGNFSLYAHMSSRSVSNGDEVSQGEKIGMCGSTGRSTGSHLHLEHRIDNIYDKEHLRDPREMLGI